MANCGNCGAAINGTFCGACGHQSAPAPTAQAGGYPPPPPPGSPFPSAPPPAGSPFPSGPSAPSPYGQQQQGYPPPPMVYNEAPASSDWKWGYSRWIGIHYGPIPVGIILVVIILIAMKS